MREDLVTHDQLRADYPSRRELAGRHVRRREWPMLALILLSTSASIATAIHILAG